MSWFALLFVLAIVWLLVKHVSRNRYASTIHPDKDRNSGGSASQFDTNVGRARVQISELSSAASANQNGDDGYAPELYWFPVEGTGRRIDAHLTIDYESTSRKITRRDVDVHTFYRGENGCMFDCFCHLRKAKRTLSSRSVRNAVDRDTGEIVVDLCKHFEDKYEVNPEKPYDTLLQEYGWAIMVLNYVAGADGAIRAPERKAIAEFCLRREGHEALSIEKLDRLIRELGRPDKSVFHRMIRERSAAERVIKDIDETAVKMVEGKAKAHTDQERAIAYMKDKWRSFLAN